MACDETLRKKTLDILLANVKNVEDLEMIDCAIQDYESFGHKLTEYRQKVEELRNAYLG
jgi:hypothetical protein